MKPIVRKILLLLAIATSCHQISFAQPKGFDVFVPISKYLTQGDAESLSAWFASSMDIGILVEEKNCSRKQAREITKSFFRDYTPRSFEITHTASKGASRYVIGYLNAGGERFTVTIFVCSKGGRSRIEQFNITKGR